MDTLLGELHKKFKAKVHRQKSQQPQIQQVKQEQAPLPQKSEEGKDALLSADRLEFMDRGEYDRFLSPTLKENPKAVLDEGREVKQYLGNQRYEYLQELDTMNRLVGKPMSENCRAVVTIPAFQEGDNIRKTLDLFTGQKNRDGAVLDPGSFEIVIIDNHKNSLAQDKTREEVVEFQKEHPEMAIVYAHKAWEKSDPACVGNARKYACDLALVRSNERESKPSELLMVSFDADVDGLDSKYLANYMHTFDSNQHLDAAVGKWNIPEDARKKPTLNAAQRFWYMLDRVINDDSFTPEPARQRKIPVLIGRNSAFKASMYAAIGGYNPFAKCGEDLEIGWMIDNARRGDVDRFAYVNTAEVVTNPRRYLAAYVQNIPIVDQYADFHENDDVRTQDNSELLAKIPDSLDAVRLEREINAIWSSFSNWRVQERPKLERSFSTTAALLGVKLRFDPSENPESPGRIVLTSTTRLEQRIKEFTISTSDIQDLARVADTKDPDAGKVVDIQQQLQEQVVEHEAA